MNRYDENSLNYGIDSDFSSKSGGLPDQISMSWNQMCLDAVKSEPIRSENYLTDNLSNEDAIDLIYAEFVLRSKSGESFSEQEFFGRFPEYADALKRQFELDRALTQMVISPNGNLNISMDYSESNSQVHNKIGKYTIIRKLASGGQADVYRAVHPGLDQEVVIKIASDRFPLNQSRDAIVNEGRLLARLDHPHLNRVYDVDFFEECPYIVSRYIRGRTLEQYIQQEKLSFADKVKLISKIARALGTAHRQGIYHFDIKPQNIVVEDDGCPCLIDFGLGRLHNAFDVSDYKEGGLFGTLQYMPPEQALGKSSQMGPQSDLFSLGAVLFYMCTENPPYKDGPVMEMVKDAQSGSWMRESLDQCGLPVKIRSIIIKAMSFNPEERFRNCDQFADALEKYANHAQKKYLLIGSVLTLTVLVGFMIVENSFSRSSDTTKASIEEMIKPPELNIKVFDSGRYLDISERAPLRNGDRLLITSMVPAGFYATLFYLDSNGELKELCHRLPTKHAGEIRFPEKVGKVVPLIGNMGTEAIFLCVRRKSRLTASEIQNKFAWRGALPNLPLMTILSADKSGVHVKQDDRSFGEPETVQSPQAIVKDYFEQFRIALAEEVEYFQAVAYFHEGSEQAPRP